MPTFTPLTSSNFPGADEDPIVEAGNWAPVAAQQEFKIVSHTARPQNLGSDCYSRNIDVASPNDQYTRLIANVTGTAGGGSGVGCMLRAASGARTLYSFFVDHAGSNNANFSRFLAGVHVDLDLWTNTFVDGDEWTCGVEGSGAGIVLYVYRNGIFQRSVADTDGNGINSGSFGIAYSSTETLVSIASVEFGAFSSGAAAGTTLTGFGRRLQGFIYS